MHHTTQTSKLDLKNLAYQKSLIFAPAQMFGAQPDGTCRPVVVATQDHAARTAVLPEGCTRLVIEGSARFLAESMYPHCCAGLDTLERASALAEIYRELGGFRCLAARYVENFANGRFARNNWQNVESATIELTFKPDGSTGTEKTIAFDASRLERGELLGIDAMKAATVTGNPSELEELVTPIAAALSRRRGEQKRSSGFTLEYRWTAEMPQGAYVFPDMTLASSEAGGLNLGFIRPEAIAASVHSIDTWHGDPQFGAIPVNAHGAVHRNLVLRGKGRPGPSLRMLANEFQRLEADAERGFMSDDLHYFMANMVRGFVLEKV